MKLAGKLWLSVAFVSLLTLSVFAALSSAQIKRLIAEREGAVMAQQIESYTDSIDHYFQNIQKSAQVLLYSPVLQERFSGNLSELTGNERIRAFNEVYDHLHRMWDNLYGIDAIYLIDRNQNVFKISVEDANMPTFLTGSEFARQGWYDRLDRSDGPAYWSFVRWNENKASILMFSAMYSKTDLSLIGRLVISVSPQVFDGFLSDSNLGEGLNSIVDSAGIAYTSGSGIGSSPVDVSALSGSKGTVFLEREGEPYMLAYAKNKLTGWTFIHLVPQRIVLKDLKNVNSLWLLFMLVSILLMTVASAFLLRTITMPLARMVKLVREVERGNLGGRFNVRYKDELGRLGHAFNHMLDKLQDGIPLIREKFIRSMLERHMDEEELREFERRLDIRFDRPFFQVVLLYVHGSSNGDALAVAESAIRDMEQQGGLIADRLAANQFCLIFNSRREETLARLEPLVGKLREELGLQAHAFVGSVYDHVRFVKTSFDEAMTQLKYRVGERMEAEPAIVFSVENWEHRYPESFENRLLYYMDEGDFDSCGAVMEELIAYARKHPIAPAVVQSFLAAMHHHLNKRLIQTEGGAAQLDSDWLGKLNRRLSVEPFEKNCRDFVAQLRKQLGPVLQRKKAHSPQIAKSLALIRERFDDPSLGVDAVARTVGWNANYFSQTFKKEVGVGFAEYVSGLRLERARRLLSETALKIKEVAEKAGFADSHYFGVWFKDNTGLTPSQYRKGQARAEPSNPAALESGG
jgi:AraC-like DNA-binding protein/HAMP domain-containing protein